MHGSCCTSAEMGWGVSEHRDLVSAIPRVLMELYGLQKISLELFSHSLFLESFEGFIWISASQQEHGFRELSALAAGEGCVCLCVYVIKSYRFICQVFGDYFFFFWVLFNNAVCDAVCRRCCITARCCQDVCCWVFRPDFFLIGLQKSSLETLGKFPSL